MKKLLKAGLSIGTTGMALSMMPSAGSQALANSLPMIGSAVGMGEVLNAMNSLNRKKK